MSNPRTNRTRRGNRNDGNGSGGGAKPGSRANNSGNNTANSGANNGSANANKNPNGGGSGRQAEKGRSNSRRRKGPRKKQVDPRVFWGDPEQLAELGSERATITANPSAVVQSLGRPPLSGQQNAAEHYFIAVYDRAVNLAAALAAAGNLLDLDELDDGPH